MKITLFVATIFAVMIHILCETEEEFYKIKEECFDQSDIPIEDRIIYNPEDTKLKCFNACTYTKTGLMKNGKLIAAKFIERVSHVLANAPESEEQSFTELLNDCANKANEKTNACEVAHAMIKCL